MAWFKFGKQDDTVMQAPVESAEAMRKRALHRLIGAAVLVGIGMVGFPILFDNQPRPVAIDIPIEIPDKAKVSKPLAIPPAVLPSAAAPAAAPATPSGTATAAPVSPQTSLNGQEDIVPPKTVVAEQKQPPAQENKAQAAIKTEATHKADEATKAAEAAKLKAAEQEKAKAKTAEAAKAKALLEDQTVNVAAADSDARYIVQFGAFSDETKARDARMKVERAGLKTYSQVAQTPEGKRIRVRVGPFASRAEADKAASKIKALDLPASILTL
jgi:DedD protein